MKVFVKQQLALPVLLKTFQKVFLFVTLQHESLVAIGGGDSVEGLRTRREVEGAWGEGGPVLALSVLAPPV